MGGVCGGHLVAERGAEHHRTAAAARSLGEGGAGERVSERAAKGGHPDGAPRKGAQRNARGASAQRAGHFCVGRGGCMVCVWWGYVWGMGRFSAGSA